MESQTRGWRRLPDSSLWLCPREGGGGKAPEPEGAEIEAESDKGAADSKGSARGTKTVIMCVLTVPFTELAGAAWCEALVHQLPGHSAEGPP